MADYLAELQHRLQTRSLFLQIVEAGIVLIVTVAALFGNFLVCWAVYNNRRLRTIPNMFVTSLALSDICMAIFVMPITFRVLLSNGWVDTTHTCIFQGYMIFSFAMASLHTLTAISINRYFVIVRPNLYKKIFTKKRTACIIIGIWVSVFIYPFPPAIVTSMSYSFQPGKATCMYFFESNLVYTLFLELGFIGTPMNIMMACYFKVFKAVRQNQRRVAAMRNNASGSSNNPTLNVEEVKITNNLAVVLLAFVMCWGAVAVVDVTDLIKGKTTLPRTVYMVYITVIFLSSSLNPFIYGIMNRKFRQEFKKFLCCKKNIRENIETSRTSHVTDNRTTGTVVAE